MALDPTAGRRSEVEVCAEAQVLNPVLVELPVRRMAVEVFEQELELPGEQDAVDLDARACRDVGAAVVFLVLLDVDGRDRSPARRASGPGAGELQTILDRPRMEARGVLAEQVAAACINADQLLQEIVGGLEIDALVAEIDAIGTRAKQEFVA